MPRPRRFFTPEYKAEVVELVRSTGKTVGQVSRELDLTETAVREWVKRADLDAGRRTDGLTTAECEELRRLRREVRDLREEREILRKAAVLRQGDRSPVSCYRLIEAEKAHHGVSRLCRVLGVARAGYYAWASRPPSATTMADRALTEQIRQIHARSRGTYGAPRVHAELRLGFGVRVGRKRVARLMRSAGIVGVHRRRRHGLTRRDPAATAARTWSSGGSPTSSGSAVGRGRYPAAHRRGLVVPRGGAGRLQPPGGRLGDGRPPTHRAGPGRPRHGDRPAQPRAGPGPSHRPWLPGRTPAWPSAAGSPRPAWSPRWVPSATRWTTPSPRASSPPWSASCWTATPGPPEPGCAQPCSTSWRSSPTVNAATPPAPPPPPRSQSPPGRSRG
jgi:transposase-like protein